MTSRPPLTPPIHNDIKIKILFALVLIPCIGIWFVPPIAQYSSYHDFADQRKILGVPNFWNVVTNLPFFVVGLFGIFMVAAGKFEGNAKGSLSKLQPLYMTFFIGLAFVGLGSSYYHLDPSNPTLIWDRLPMTIAFMAFFSIILSDHISERLGLRLFLPMIVFGVFSVFYWGYTEAMGRGDLRPYVLVQFVPILLIPVILLMFRSVSPDRKYIWMILGAYAFSKVPEMLDGPVYELIGAISGHSIKHLIASLAGIFFCLAWLSGSGSGRINVNKSLKT